jgi:DNA invertase Pin-like site-specific DNA recombinase
MPLATTIDPHLLKHSRRVAFIAQRSSSQSSIACLSMLTSCFGLQKAGVEFVCVDDPHMTPLTLGIRAVVAQHERELISKRTKEALAAAKARGVKLGGKRKGAGAPAYARKRGTEALQQAADSRASDLASDIASIQEAGATTLQAIADGLNDRGIPAARSGKWSAVQVKRVSERL